MRTHWISAAAVLLIAFGLMALATGCDAEPTAAGDDEAVIANTHCPIMTDIELDRHTEIPEGLTREWNGKTIGFCCGSCPPAWDELSDEEKQEKLEGIIADNPSHAAGCCGGHHSH